MYTKEELETIVNNHFSEHPLEDFVTEVGDGLYRVSSDRIVLFTNKHGVDQIREAINEEVKNRYTDK